MPWEIRKKLACKIIELRKTSTASANGRKGRRKKPKKYNQKLSTGLEKAEASEKSGPISGKGRTGRAKRGKTRRKRKSTKLGDIRTKSGKERRRTNNVFDELHGGGRSEAEKAETTACILL